MRKEVLAKFEKEMLGDHSSSLLDRAVNFIAYPKYYTPHYNQNGKRVFTSKLTIVIFILLVFYMFCMLVYVFIPLTAGYRTH